MQKRNAPAPKPKFQCLGFTLIELMVAVSIIALAATMAVISFQTVQKNSRDQRRKSDLAQLQTILEIYFVRNNLYPNENFSSECDSSMGGGGLTCEPAGNDWANDSDAQDIVTTGIIGELPRDPQNKLLGTIRYLYHLELDKSGEGDPPCLTSGSESCRYLLQTVLENGEKYGGGKGQCIYSLVGGGGTPYDPNSVNFTTDCIANITPTGWGGLTCCAQ